MRYWNQAKNREPNGMSIPSRPGRRCGKSWQTIVRVHAPDQSAVVVPVDQNFDASEEVRPDV